MQIKLKDTKSGATTFGSIKCKFPPILLKLPKVKSRKFCETNINRIADYIKSIDFSILNDQVINLDKRWYLFAQIISNTIDLYAPEKEIYIKKNNNKLPWFDLELKKSQKVCSILYGKFIKSNDPHIRQEYFNARNSYQRLLRTKKIEYLSSKTSSNFKNQRNFGSFTQQL